MILASAVMAAGLWLAARGLGSPLAGDLPGRILALAALVAGGVALFGLCAQVFGAARLGELRRMVGR
jgi:hypothetical protein